MTERLIFTATLTLTLCLSALPVLGQDASSSASKQSAQINKPKVWTDDNIGSVRSPSDLYQLQEAKAAQDTASKQAGSAQATAAPAVKVEGNLPNIPAPTTVAQADALIKQEQAELASQQEYVEETKKEQANAPDSEKDRLGWRIKSRTEVMGRIQAEIAQLQAEKDALRKKPAGENGGSAESGSSNNGSTQN